MFVPVLRKFLLAAACIGSALTAIPAAASDWVTIGVDKDGRSWLVEKSSIIRGGDMVLAWKRVEFSQPAPYPPTGKLISVAIFLELTNCKRRSTGVKASKLLSADGSLIASHIDADDKITWQSVADGSLLESAMQFTCDGTPPSSKDVGDA
jgi:hypothetical protein